MDSGKMGLMRQEYGLTPKDHFRKIMKHLLKSVLDLDGASVTGKRGCLGIPQRIPETVNCTHSYLYYIYHVWRTNKILT